MKQIWRRGSVTQQEELLIVQDYRNGLSVHKLKSKYHHGDEVIKEILKKNNCYLGRYFSKQYLANTINENDIIKEYLTGKSLQYLNKKYHIHKEKLKQILKAHNIKPRSLNEQLQYTNRKYFVNKDYFNTNSSDVWYIAGFIAADGNIAKYSNSLDIQLSQKDAGLLNIIAEKLSFTGKVKLFTTQHGDEHCRLTITDKDLIDSLLRFNITRNKTFTYSIPSIPSEYVGDFLRGYFDGDGWVQKDGQQISIVSASKQFSIDLQTILLRYGIAYTEYVDNRKQHTLYDIRILRQTSIRAFYELIYNNIENKLYLTRKYERFQSLFE